LNKNGTLDNTFGTNGQVIYAVTSANDEVNSIVIQPDDKIIAVGDSYQGANPISLLPVSKLMVNLTILLVSKE
jgi:hypothetical protein